MLQKRTCDRFIPIRSGLAFQSHFSAQKHLSPSTAYTRILSPHSSKYLRFRTPSPSKNQPLSNFLLQSVKKHNNCVNQPQTRKANRILDAPDIVNNFYYHPLDWSSSNKIGIALSSSLYVLNGKEVTEVDRYSNIDATCVKFWAQPNSEGELVFAGETTGRVEIYDLEKMAKIRVIKGHYDRVGCIQKSQISNMFISGSKDKLIKLNDIRIKKADIATLQKHRGEICGLSTVKNYLASGGNDNRVVIWDLRRLIAINQVKQHKSAVKAISWCPWKTCLLATGGGSQDKRIILWNGNSNIIQQKIQTQSQIVALQWKQQGRKLVSGHFSGKGSYCVVWSGTTPQIKLKGHDGRILGMKINPNNQNQLSTLASDQTLRFWDIGEIKNYEQGVKSSAKKEQDFTQHFFR